MSRTNLEEKLLDLSPRDPWTLADARAWWRDRGEAALEATRPGPQERESGQAVFPATASGSQS